MSTARKELVWGIKKNLFKLTGIEAYQLAKEIATDSEGAANLQSTDEEGCVDYILNYMQSDKLLSSEDEGMSQLLSLNDLVCSLINGPDTVVITNGVAQEHNTLTTLPTSVASHTTLAHDNDDTLNTRDGISIPAAAAVIDVTQQYTNTDMTSVDHLQVMHEELGKKLQYYKERTNHSDSRHHGPAESTPAQLPRQTRSIGDPEKMVTLKDLSYLQRREFKVHGGQIGDQNSDITYNTIYKQMEEGVREGFTETEIIRGVLRIVKPGAFKDMLSHKDEITICELKGFLRSHLGEKASTELFRELMCAKQNDQEPPQQFLYRMIGLKQKILFQSKQVISDIRYDPKTVQEIFLHTIYQGLGSKHTDIRQQLRPLLSNSKVTDEEVVSKVMKIISDENEHQRRLGYLPRQKAMHTHSVQAEGGEQVVNKKENQTIQQLRAQVETLTSMVAALMDQHQAATHAVHPKTLSQAQPPPTSIPSQVTPPTAGPLLTRKGKPPACTNCSQQGLENCNHCFVCGDPGHRAIGCLERARLQGNGSRSLLRGNQRPFNSSSPTQ